MCVCVCVCVCVFFLRDSITTANMFHFFQGTSANGRKGPFTGCPVRQQVDFPLQRKRYSCQCGEGTVPQKTSRPFIDVLETPPNQVLLWSFTPFLVCSNPPPSASRLHRLRLRGALHGEGWGPCHGHLESILQP